MTRVGAHDLVERLAAAGCLAPESEAEALLAAAPDAATLDAWTRRRVEGEPLAWLVGSVAFGGRRIRVDPGVYVPRPQSEALAGRVATLLPPHGAAADLCTGSGAVASVVGAAAPAATVVGIDIDRRAVRCARGNGVLAFVGDLGDALPTSAFDVVTAVAPYVPTGALALLPSDVRTYEPEIALDGGLAGLDVVLRTIESAARLLRSGGHLLLELGGDQDAAVAPALAAAGFGAATSWTDEDGDLRGLLARAG